jgi:superfamily II DNA or RNA helicase
MIEINISGSSCFIKGLSPIDKSIIKKTLSYIPKRFYHNKGDKSLPPDGIFCMFDSTLNTFPIGYLKDIQSFLTQRNIPFRVTRPNQDGLLTAERINYVWSGPELMEHQQVALIKLLENLVGVVSLPTGAGKTMIALRAIYLLGYRAIILVHNKLLLYQWERAIRDNLSFIKVGLIGDSKFSEGNITVASVFSLKGDNKVLENRYDIMILDEAHHASADSFYNVAKKIGAVYRFGLSATPYREDGEDKKIWAYVGNIVFKVSAREMITKGILSDFDYKIIKMRNGFDYGKTKWQQELYDGCLDQANNNILVDEAINYLKLDYKVYMDVRLLDHGEELTRMINDRGSYAHFISGSDNSSYRSAVLEDFINEKPFILVSTLLKEGVDLPDLNCIILAGPSKSMSDNIQKIGRALRTTKDKRKAVVIERQDLKGNLKRWFNNRKKFINKYYEL